MAILMRETKPPETGPVSRRLALVLNDKAGALLAAADTGPGLPDLARQAGFEVVAMPRDGTLAERIAAARDSAAPILVVAGGDGTVACAAAVLQGGDAALGVIPCGTMNLLAKDLRIPVDDHAAAFGVLARGRVQPIDLGDMAGHVFSCAVMLGTPARLGHHREEGRRRGNGPAGWLHFARAALRAVRRHRALRLEVSVDGVAHRLHTPALTITVNALDDSTGRLFGRSCLDGGELVIYAVRRVSVGALLRLAVNTLRGRFDYDKSVTILRGQSISIAGAAAALRVLIDGEEQLLASPVEAKLLPRALRVVAG
jgi:diacylglycerol kinase family enzyme